MPRLHELPADVLLDIAFHLPVVDILSLKQTCRTMYSFVCTDYLWHQIAAKAQIPLNLPGDQELTSYSGQDLQRIMLKAIRLDRNWRRPTTAIKNLVSFAPTAELDRQSIDEMRLCGGSQWLVTAQRNRPRGRSSVNFTFWSLHSMHDIYRDAVIEVTGEYKHFAVDLDAAGTRASLAVTVTFCKEEIVKIYDVPLDQRVDVAHPTHDGPRLAMAVSKPESLPGLLDAVTIQGGIVASTIVDICGTQPILLVDTSTGAKCLADPACEVSLRMSVKFHSNNLVLTHATTDSVEIRTHKVPSTSEWSRTDDIPTIKLGDPISSHRIPLPHASDVRVSHFLGAGQSDTSSFLAFDLGTKLHCARLPSTSSNEGSESDGKATAMSALTLPEMTSAEVVSVGAHRAVWLERNWELDEMRLVKFWWARMQDGSRVPKSGVLIPAYPDLPLQPSEVRALELDEATGRLCLGSYSGSVFVLDYVDDL